MAMKLNNDKNPDLANFQQIKTAYRNSLNEINNDVIKISYIKSPLINRGLLTVDGVKLLDATDLNILKSDAKTPVKKIMYLNTKKTYIKIYSFLSKLTKSIAESKTLVKDKGTDEVVFDTAKMLVDKMENPTAAVNLACSMERQTYRQPQQVAKELNKIIKTTLKNLS